jgi:hypothetical protein
MRFAVILACSLGQLCLLTTDADAERVTFLCTTKVEGGNGTASNVKMIVDTQKMEIKWGYGSSVPITRVVDRFIFAEDFPTVEVPGQFFRTETIVLDQATGQSWKYGLGYNCAGDDGSCGYRLFTVEANCKK